MPPKKRSKKNEGTQNETMTTNEPTSPLTEAQDPLREQTEDGREYPTFQPTRRRRGSGGVKWFPVFKRLFYISLLVLVPMILNYAALNHELRVLPLQGKRRYIQAHALM